MFFTQEDYRKIEKWLLANSRKDTGFVGAATPLKGNETVVLVQDGKNVKTSVKDIVDQFFLLGVSDFLNITDKYGESYISIGQAIQLIPFRSRKEGQVITFIDESGNWAIYQFQGKALNQWNNPTLWIDLLAKVSGIPIIDSEDITTKENSAKQVSLYLADKQYNEADYSGLGKIYLRKNIQTIIDPLTEAVINVNLLTQSMLAKENTTYIIQYDYNLNKQTISIPEGSVLLFEGGSIDNGAINCNGTTIVDKFSGNATIVGTYSFQDAQADEEDITQNQSSVLKFKDRKYEPDKYSGLGRVILRKNIVEIDDPIYGKVTKNILFQDMIAQANTIYEIRYDYNLNGSTVTIPEGCILDMRGGSVTNGTINCVDTIIISTDASKLDVTLTGTYRFDSEKLVTSNTEDINISQSVDRKSHTISAMLADRGTTNGMGYVILRKDKSFEEQVTQENTIYEIRYDFDLNGEEITIPEGCILDFKGGSISGSCTITGNNTNINAGLVKIFNTDVTLSGTWNVSEAYPEWFGAIKEDNTVDSRLAIQKCLDYFLICVLSGKYYLLSNSNEIGITMPIGAILKSNFPNRLERIVSNNKCGIIAVEGSGITKIVVLNWSVIIEHICIYGFHKEDWYSNTNDLIGIATEDSSYVSRVSIIDTEVSYCKYGIEAVIYLSKFDRVVCSNNYGGIYIHGTDSSSMTSLHFTNCYVLSSVEFGYKFYKIVYSSLNCCACDHFGIEAKPSEISAAYTFLNCEGISVISCGIEQSYRALYSLLCISLIVEGCNFSTNYTNAGIDHNNWIFFKNATSCIFNSYISIYNTSENWNGKYFLVEDYRNNINAITITNVNYDAISYSFTGGSDSGNVDGVKREVKVIGTSVVETEITKNTAIESIINYNPCMEFTRRFFISVSTDCQMIFNLGNPFIDNFGCQTLIFEGHDFEHSLFRVDVGYKSPTFKNYKKIIFKNIGFSWVNGKSIPGVNFIDTDVTFINCRINGISGNFPIKAINSKIEFINTFVFNDESQYDRDFIITGYCNSSIRAISSTINEGIPEGVEIIYSNGKRAKVINSVGCNAPINMSAADITALKALTSGLQSYEKEMLEGSIGTVSDTHKTYTFTNSNWYSPDGTLA